VRGRGFSLGCHRIRSNQPPADGAQHLRFGQFCFDTCEFLFTPCDGILDRRAEGIALLVDPIPKIIIFACYRIICALADTGFGHGRVCLKQPTFQNEIAGGFDKCQVRALFYALIIPPLIDHSLVFLRNLCIMVPKGMLDGAKRRENADDVEAESVANEPSAYKVIKTPSC
jgi:hypothetical protein